MTTPKGFTRTETGLTCERCGTRYERDACIRGYVSEHGDEVINTLDLGACLYCGENAVGRVFVRRVSDSVICPPQGPSTVQVEKRNGMGWYVYSLQGMHACTLPESFHRSYRPETRSEREAREGKTDWTHQVDAFHYALHAAPRLDPNKERAIATVNRALQEKRVMVPYRSEPITHDRRTRESEVGGVAGACTQHPPKGFTPVRHEVMYIGNPYDDSPRQTRKRVSEALARTQAAHGGRVRYKREDGTWSDEYSFIDMGALEEPAEMRTHGKVTEVPLSERAFTLEFDLQGRPSNEHRTPDGRPLTALASLPDPTPYRRGPRIVCQNDEDEDW